MINQDVFNEIESINAIYPNILTKLNDNILLIRIPEFEFISVQISLPIEYPLTESPKILDVNIQNDKSSKLPDNKYIKNIFIKIMKTVFNPGNVCIFDFLSEINGTLDIEIKNETEQEIQSFDTNTNINPLDNWVISESIVDRGSTFTAFALKVTSEVDAINKLNLLKTNNRISRASHVITAWRISGPKQIIYQNCDDDGETAAGSRMLHLLVIMNVHDIVVAVVRWFGGVHIGPDRFKHINSVTREVVIKGGFVDESKTKNKKHKRK